MTKFRKFIPVLVCSFLVAGGSVAVAQGLNQPLAREAQAVTDCGTVAFSYDNNSNGNGVYLTAPANDIPFPGEDDWSLAYYPVNGSGGVFFDGVDIGSIILKKYGSTKYYLALGDCSHALSQSNIDVLLTITGTWYCNYNAEEYRFTVSPSFQKTWSGLGWVDYYDIEKYDVVSLLDTGIPDFMGTAIDQEAGYSKDNLYNNSFPITNDTGSFAFRFGWEALDDASSTLTVRVGSSSSWGAGHTLRFQANNTWGPVGTVVLNECIDDGKVQGTGDIQVDLKSGAEHTLEFGIAKIKNSADYNAFVRYDGFLVSSLRWTLNATPLTTRVGMYYTETDINVTNKTTQVFGTEPLRIDSVASATALNLKTSYDLDPNFNSWEEHGRAYVASNISYNGVAKAYAGTNYFKKPGTLSYYIDLSAIGITTPAANDILTIGGSFKFIHEVSTGVYKAIKIAFAQSAFKYNGTTWMDYDLGLLENSSADQLEAGNLLANIGRTRPDSNRASSIKCFDQGVEWDADLGAEVDKLVYKKDTNGHTGVYFTSGDQDTHGEFRVYLPDNGYKTESKGYAMSHFSFDYILDSTGTPTKTNRNHSLTPDGYYIAPLPAATSNFTLQVLCHNSSSMYFDFEESLINDGRLHTFSFDLDYSDVMGFCFVLWNFKGTFFMSNCHADYLAYNQALNEFVYNTLKMYNYKAATGECVNYYADAKTAYLALTASEKTIFNTEAAYGSARARLSAWAVANDEVFDSVNGTFAANSHGSLINLANNNTIIISVVICSFVMVSLAVVAFEIKRRKFHK